MYGMANLQWQEQMERVRPAKLLLVYNKSSGDISGEIPLNVLFKKFDNGDSTLKTISDLTLKFSGVFPYNQPEFFSLSDNEKEYNMDLKIQIGDSVEIKRIQIILTMLLDQKSTPAPGSLGATLLPCRFNTVIKILPEKFGLNKPPFNWTKSFVASIENGFINVK